MNETLAQHDSPSRVQVMAQAASLAVIMFSSIFGNVLILLAIYTNHQLREMAGMLIASLGCADLLLAVTGMPFTLVSSITFEWIFGPELCEVTGMLNILFCIASLLHLAAIALERYVAIIKPLKYHTIMTSTNLTIIVVYIWAHSLFFAVLPIIGWSRYKYLPMESMCIGDWPNSVGYAIFLFTVNFFIPLFIMAYCYYNILKAAKDHSRRIRPTTVGQFIVETINNNVASDEQMGSVHKEEIPVEENKRQKAATEKKYKQDTKAAKTLLLVMGTFVFCWSPHIIGMMCLLFPSCNWPKEYFAVSTWLAMMNSGCNPIIYGALNRRFRRSFKLVLCCGRAKRRVLIDGNTLETKTLA